MECNSTKSSSCENKLKNSAAALCSEGGLSGCPLLLEGPSRGLTAFSQHPLSPRSRGHTPPRDPSWIEFWGGGLELPGPVALHPRQPTEVHLSLFVSIPGCTRLRKQMQKGNSILLRTLSPTKAAQWTKAFLGGSRDIRKEEGNGLSGRTAQWWNVWQRNICRLMWWKDHGMLESGCPGLGYLPAMWSSASLFISLCLSFFICKTGIKLPLTSHRLVEGLNGIMDAKAHCKRLNPYTNVTLTGSSRKPCWILDLWVPESKDRSRREAGKFFSIRAQMVNILGFEGHWVSVTTTKFCWCAAI